MAREVNMASEKVEKEVKKEATPQFEIIEVATQTQNVIRNNTTGEAVTSEQALTLILNEVQAIKRLLA